MLVDINVSDQCVFVASKNNHIYLVIIRNNYNLNEARPKIYRYEQLIYVCLVYSIIFKYVKDS